MVEEMEEEEGLNPENELEQNRLSQLSAEEKNKIFEKGKSKLEKLLAQPDIFDTLRKINARQKGSHFSLDELLDSHANMEI